EEVYYREAKAMGLDQNDPIIRRRLQQKLEFISEDTAQAEPTDADLGELLKSQPDKFRIGRTYTFTHVYFNPEHWQDNLNTAANSALAELSDNKGAPELATLGDRFLLGNRFDEIPASEVSKLFGDEFASKLSEVSVSKWQGPIQSGYGLHLVLVERRSEGASPSLDEARETLQREWKEANRKKANDDFFQKLSNRYTIVIEPLAAAPATVSNSALMSR
ncbi:MAG: peptidylprolyl isomerase, partial [Limisphaerales bacterium]